MKTVWMLLASLLLTGCARQDHARIGSLEVLAPWSRETPLAANVAAGYLSIHNHGQRDDRLLAVESAAVRRVDIHQMWMDDGVMRMRPLADGLPIPAGETVVLAPGGSHLMFIAPARHAVAGDRLDAVLVFRDAGRLPMSFEVRGLSAQGGAPHAHH
ncbi:MAG: copper chaperone PCu(A)C [Cupriavidus sp.]|nr:MAG: copper chaperone PCu(A)C [Cupriavidus sp.]